MNEIERCTAALTAALLLLAFVACNNDNNDDTSGDPLQTVVTDASATEAVSAIKAASSSIHITTGMLTADEVAAIADALRANTSALVALDLSKSGVTEFRDDNQFQDCAGLVAVVLPESLVYLRARLFLNCTSLVSVAIPAKATIDGNYVFVNCPKLTDITVAAGNEQLSASGGMLFLTSSYMDSEGTTKTEVLLAAYPSAKGAITLPSNITGLAWRPFVYNNLLTEVTVPENVMALNRWAFYDCPELTALHLPASLVSVGSSKGFAIGFFKCPKLATITVAAENKYFSASNGRLYYYPDTLDEPDYCGIAAYPTASGVITIDGVDYAYLGGTEITSVTLSASVTTISSSAFEYCEKLTSITIQGDIEAVGYDAFRGCTALRSITLPASVQRLNPGSFAQCTSLATVRIEATTPPALNL